MAALLMPLKVNKSRWRRKYVRSLQEYAKSQRILSNYSNQIAEYLVLDSVF
jgi:hypothetical protein